MENKIVFDKKKKTKTKTKQKIKRKKKRFSLGISKVKGFVKEQYNFLSHTDFIEKYKFQLQPLTYFGHISAQ